MNRNPGMAGAGFNENEKDDSRENEGILALGASEEEETAVCSAQPPTFHLDLNLQPEVEGLGNSLLGFDFGFPEKQTDCSTAEPESVVFGFDLKRMERNPDVEMVASSSSSSPSSSSKKRRFSVEEKGKAKLDGFTFDDEQQEAQPINLDLDLDLGLTQTEIDGWMSYLNSPGSEAERPNSPEVIANTNPNLVIDIDDDEYDNNNVVGVGEVDYMVNEGMEDFYVYKKREETRRNHEIARSFAQKLAREVDSEFGDALKSSASKDVVGHTDKDDDQTADFESPFGLAMEMIKTRNSTLNKYYSRLRGNLEVEFKWTPKTNKGLSFMAREAPSLLELSLRVLAKNAEAMVSLQHVPDFLRHRLSQLACDSRKMDAHFLELLARGSPTEIVVKDCSRVTEEEFTQIFGHCDTNNLTVLELHLCGSCLPDYVLQETLARSPESLPALVALSLNGAYRLSDSGLNQLALSAPALQSINLSQCSLLTSAGINHLASYFESTLRELYLDECQNVQAMVVLPSLKKLKCLEVLSMTGIQTVCDVFVIDLVEACGKNMKELVFANCLGLTDRALKFVGKHCPRLCALDLSYIGNLTDSSMRYLANGCPSINRLILCRNGFSDEAIAAFLETSGGSLTELSLNKVSSVGLYTALSLSKCSRKLFSLDLSWCRNLTDEALGLIVDSCLSLRLLKLFGCTQITDVFLSGHSNTQVQIIGLKMTALTKAVKMLEPQ